ncbi:PepSY domain-containing protein [Pseudotenacibaculum haliotis]|uniref:PepSY domain-containing protein n=1 Tax=Pseudotenacibaculum haliotis TaxID=1862138 RepID=A0ABW5LXN8_9FLAO
MITSIWRYSHLALAISSFVFILVASITGIILAFEPISEQLKPYATDVEKHSLASTIQILNEKYDEVLTLEKDHNGFIIASVITEEGADDRFYIDPLTGEKIGDIIEKAPIFQFATNLHRSLFLKTTGRVIIAIVSFFLFLIAVTGVLLIIKRQGGIPQFFSKVVKEDNNQYYHVILGRLTLVPIMIITLTGVYLSLEKFSLLPDEKINHSIQTVENIPDTKQPIADFEIFKNTSLKEIKSIEFPFSEDPEDYYFVKLKHTELVVHQYNGAIVSEVKHPFVSLASSLSLFLHTGRGSMLWSFVLLLSTASILYFIYSGFYMTFKRRKESFSIPSNTYRSDEAEYVILVGSETGNTYKPAALVFDAIKNLNKKVYITELNQYKEFKNLKHLLVFTSTYGKGEAPANAKNFIQKFQAVEHTQKVQFSVVGFGSLAYEDFCEFAIDIDTTLKQNSNFYASTDLYKIHNQSFSDFSKWVQDWSTKTNVSLQIEEPKGNIKPKKQHRFDVVNRTDLNQDQTFLLQLRPKKKTAYQSGDLLEFFPQGETVPRYYSVGIKGKDVLLSIKKHDLGVCSSFFSQLNANDTIEAGVQKNKAFHFPKKVPEVVMIANGTGIAPFIGMIQENKRHIKAHLFWGGRTKPSFDLYSEIAQKALQTKQLSSLHLAFSREEESKQYVQDSIKEKSELIATVLAKKGVIMICGSLAMEKGVRKVLESIVQEKLQSELASFGWQIKTDCY